MKIKYESFDFETDSLGIENAELKICMNYGFGFPSHSTGISELIPNITQHLNCSADKGTFTCSVKTVEKDNGLYQIYVNFITFEPKKRR